MPHMASSETHTLMGLALLQIFRAYSVVVTPTLQIFRAYSVVVTPTQGLGVVTG